MGINQAPLTPPPFNNKPKRKIPIWVWLVASFVLFMVFSMIFGELDEREKIEESRGKVPTKEEWTADLMNELDFQSQYTDSVLKRAKRTKAPQMLSGYVSDMRSIADKEITDSTYMEVYDSDEVKSLMEKNSAKARKVLPELLKIRRAEYVRQLKDKLWEENIDVKTSNGGTTIIFIGGVFAINKNIKNWETELEPALIDMGFKRVEYKWIPSAPEYTYYDLTK